MCLSWLMFDGSAIETIVIACAKTSKRTHPASWNGNRGGPIDSAEFQLGSAIIWTYKVVLLSCTVAALADVAAVVAAAAATAAEVAADRI